MIITPSHQIEQGAELLSVVLDIQYYWVNNFEEFGNSRIIKTQTLTPAHSQGAFPRNKVSFHLLTA